MEKSFKNALKGYKTFRQKYAHGDTSVMQSLSLHGQKPEIMIVSCCDSRVDPALILQCEPGDLFITRNVANIVPPFERDDAHHGTSAALEFAIRFLKVKHVIILGHSQCGGIQSLINEDAPPNDFISQWMALVKMDQTSDNVNEYAKRALKKSYQNCLTFPWIVQKVTDNELTIHLWFFDIQSGKIFTNNPATDVYEELVV